VQPDVVMPAGFEPDSISVSQQGRVSVKVDGQDEPVDVAQLDLYRFPNPEGLSAVGDNLFKETPASGAVVAGTPGQEGMGTIEGKFLEMSNVSVAKEMVDLIVAQRAYEFNSKTIQTSDAMLETATQIKRS
jgi:flagellar basal-body rod protein FlgG